MEYPALVGERKTMKNFAIENGVLISYDGDDTDVVIPDGVTSIGHWAFSDRYEITSVTIPDSVTSIGWYAFFHCVGLTSVVIGNGVTTIGENAFTCCYDLTSVTIPDNVTSIGGGAFSGCHKLTSIDIGNGVTSIGGGAFSGCDKLPSVRTNYKAFALTRTGKLKCIDKIYTVGKKSMVRGKLKLCRNGIHYCTNLFDIFTYYYGEYGRDFAIGICEVSEENVGRAKCDSKRCARWVKPTRILTREEVIKLLNNK